jgi:hypothetical protein
VDAEAVDSIGGEHPARWDFGTGGGGRPESRSSLPTFEYAPLERVTWRRASGMCIRALARKPLASRGPVSVLV